MVPVSFGVRIFSIINSETVNSLLAIFSCVKEAIIKLMIMICGKKTICISAITIWD